MSMVKHSQRSNKCKRCGVRSYYWFHDTERPFGNRCAESTCEANGTHASWVLCDEAGARHTCSTFPTAVPATPIYNTDDAPVPYPAAIIPPLAVSAPVVSESESSLIDTLRTLIGATLDESAVRTIAEAVTNEHSSALLDTVATVIDGKFAALSLPTVITINDMAAGTTVTLPNAVHEVMPAVLKVLLSGDNVWMTGPAGTGKSTIAENCAMALSLRFGAVSLTPTMPVSELVGYMDANGNYVRTMFRDFYEHGGVFLFDEVDNGHPSTLGKVNMAMANGHMAFPDGMVTKHADCHMAAAANTYGTGPDRIYVGRLQIDGATLDRFATVTVPVDETLEHLIAHGQGADTHVTDSLITFVRALRVKAEAHKMQVIFSPRACIFGAKLLKGGFTMTEVIAMRVRKGISDADWRKVTTDVTIPA